VAAADQSETLASDLPAGRGDMPPAARVGPRLLAELAVVGILYFLLAKFGLALASIHPNATPIWPPTGFALAAVMLRGYRVVPAVFLAALLANATTAGSIWSSAGVALGNSLECLVGGYLVARLSGGLRAFDSPAKLARFCLICLGAACPISATVGVASLGLGGFIDAASIAPVWMTWWLGDLAGALLLTPVLVLWIAAGPPRWDADRRPEAISVFLIAGLVGFVAFSPLVPPGAQHDPLGFLAIVPLMWAALRLGRRETAMIALLLSSFAVWGTQQGIGPFARADLNDSYLLLVMFVVSAAVPSLALSADVAVRRRSEESLRGADAALRQQVETGLTALGESQRALAQARSMEAALRESEDRLRLALGIAGLGTWEYDIARDVASWSAPIAEIFGLPGPTSLSRAAWGTHIHPEDRERIEAQFWSAIHRGTEYHPEYRVLRPDGAERWIACRATVLRGANGSPVRMLGIGQDVTAQKAAAERQQLLIGELDHRVRNILASAQSMLLMTARNTTTKEELASALQGRIAAMAKAHGLLTRGDWKGLDLADLLGNLLQPYGEAVRLEGERGCLLPSREAVGLALALHELGTNAAKYGALSAAGGRVEVGWRTSPSDPRRVRLEWRESGGPPVRPPARRGFGSQLIQSVVPKVELAFPESGVVCSIELKRAGNVAMPAKAASPPQVEPARDADGARPLAGERVLILEDEVLPMLAVRAALEEAGAEIAGAATSLPEAHALLDRNLSLALLDINIGGEMSFALAERLVARGVPVLFATGYDAASLAPAHLRSVPSLQKPVDAALLVRRLAELAAAARRQPGAPAIAPEG